MPGVLCPHTTFLSSCHPLPNPRPCITQIPFTRSSVPAGGCLGQPDRPDALGRGLLDNSLASAEESTEEQEAGFLGELGQLGSYRLTFPRRGIRLQVQRNGLPSVSRKVVFWRLKYPLPCSPILFHPTSTLELYRMLDVEGSL